MDETVSSSFILLLTDHIQSTTTRNGSEGKSGIFNQESRVPYLRVCVMCFIKLVAAVLKLVLYILVEKYSTVNFSPYIPKDKSCVLVLLFGTHFPSPLIIQASHRQMYLHPEMLFFPFHHLRHSHKTCLTTNITKTPLY